jgi:hypothetical protein
MAKKKKGRKAVYRDKKTGRFASKATYKRAKKRGSKRYVRKFQKVKRVRKRKAAPKKHEYQVNVKYSSSKRNEVQVQISAIGPPNATRKEVIGAIEYYIHPETDGENLPGWTVRINFWEKYGKQTVHDDEEARENLRRFFGDAELLIENKTTGTSL